MNGHGCIVTFAEATSAFGIEFTEFTLTIEKVTSALRIEFPEFTLAIECGEK